MKWMCVVILLGTGQHIEKPDLTKEECQQWKHQQHYAPQFPIPVGPNIMFCEPYWEA